MESDDEQESRRYERDLFGDDDDDDASIKSDDEPGRSGANGSREQRESGSGDEQQEDKAKDEKAKEEKEKKVKPKKQGPVKHILLNEDMLCGKNGLIKIEEIFKDFKFQGKGHEQQDLDRMLHKLEHWVHVLHPRYPFGQTLERIEFLGNKRKSVKTYVKKIRMGLISTTEKEDDFMNLQNEMSSEDEAGAGALPEELERGATDNDPEVDIPQEVGTMSDDEFPDDFPTLPMDIEEILVTQITQESNV